MAFNPQASDQRTAIWLAGMNNFNNALGNLVSADLAQQGLDMAQAQQTRNFAQEDANLAQQKSYNNAMGGALADMGLYYSTPQSLRDPNINPYQSAFNIAAKQNPQAALQMLGLWQNQASAQAQAQQNQMSNALNSQKVQSEISKNLASVGLQNAQANSYSQTPQLNFVQGPNGITGYTYGKQAGVVAPRQSEKDKAQKPYAQYAAPSMPLRDPQTGEIVYPKIQKQGSYGSVITEVNPQYGALLQKLGGAKETGNIPPQNQNPQYGALLQKLGGAKETGNIPPQNQNPQVQPQQKSGNIVGNALNLLGL